MAPIPRVRAGDCRGSRVCVHRMLQSEGPVNGTWRRHVVFTVQIKVANGTEYRMIQQFCLGDEDQIKIARRQEKDCAKTSTLTSLWL